MPNMYYTTTGSSNWTTIGTASTTSSNGSMIFGPINSNNIVYTNNSLPYYGNVSTYLGTGATIPGPVKIEGEFLVNGKNIVKLLEKIENRLAILLDPDPEKLEKFASLKKAYNQYKVIEKLIDTEE